MRPSLRRQDAQRKGQTAKRDPLGKAAFDASIDLRIVLQDRDLQRSADRYTGGDRDRLHEMWMSGELMAIYEREAIANLRRHGKHDSAARAFVDRVSRCPTVVEAGASGAEQHVDRL